jgi:hypothetical protein
MTSDDVPHQVRPRRLLLDRFPVAYEPLAGCRIGLVPRAVLGGPEARGAVVGGPEARGAADGGAVSGASDVVWAAVDPCVVLHTVNAHERDDGLVCVTALRSEPATSSSFIEAYSAAFLHRWLVDPRTGKCTLSTTEDH